MTTGYNDLDPRHGFRQITEKASKSAALAGVFALVESVDEDNVNGSPACTRRRNSVIRRRLAKKQFTKACYVPSCDQSSFRLVNFAQDSSTVVVVELRKVIAYGWENALDV